MSVDAAPPLVIFGYDVGDPQQLRTWASEGYLPTLASVMDRGIWGRTSGPDLITENGIWVTLISGISLGTHGFYYERRLTPGTYELETVDGRYLGVRPFWAHAAPGKRAAIIDVPHSYPHPGMSGIHLADWATHHPYFAPTAAPPELLSEVRRVFGRQSRIPEKLHSHLRDDRRIYAQTLERIRRKGVLCRHLLSDPFDVIVVVFGDSHLASHQFWEYRPEHRGVRKVDDQAELTVAIRNVYQAIDREMGSVIDQLPADSNICIMSSTGLLDHYPTTGLIEAFCRQLGYQTSPPTSPRVRPTGLLREMVPATWRYALSGWLPQRVQQRLFNEKFQTGTDWNTTTAFPIPSFFTSFLRVNLKGREPRGTVEPGTEYDALLERLERDLRQLTDPETGTPAVGDIVRAREMFGGAPVDLLPDLFVEWKPHVRYRERLRHPQAELVAYPPEILRGSDHTRYGFVAMAGSSITRRGSIGDVPPVDLAPTFLALMGEPTPRAMAGKPLPIMARRAPAP